MNRIFAALLLLLTTVSVAAQQKSVTNKHVAHYIVMMSGEPYDDAKPAAAAPCMQACQGILSTWATYSAGMQTCNFTASPVINTNCFYGFQLSITIPLGASLNLPVCAPSVTPGGTGTALTNCLTQDKTTVIIAPCTTTVTTNCVGPTVTSFSWSYGSPIPYGSYSLSLIAVANGATSASTVTSTPDTASLTYALTVLNPPTGISGSIAQ